MSPTSKTNISNKCSSEVATGLGMALLMKGNKYIIDIYLYFLITKSSITYKIQLQSYFYQSYFH